MWKCKLYRLCIRNPASGLIQISYKPETWQWRHNLLAWHHGQFFRRRFFLLSSLVTGPNFMSISSLVLELWQFSFIRYGTEIRKSEITQSVFCPISGDWGKLGIPNLTQMSLMKCYWMLPNVRVTAFTVSELLRDNQKGAGVKLPFFPPPPRLSHISDNQLTTSKN